MLRYLGTFERALNISNEYSPFNLVGVMRFDGQLAPATLQSALGWMQKRYPLLDVRLEKVNRQICFSRAGRSVPLEVITREDDSHWHHIVEREFNLRLDTVNGPLLRCVYLQGEQLSEIIVSHHHIIMDAFAEIHFWKELLAACAHTPETDPVPVNLAPPAEALFPPSAQGWRRTTSLMAYAAAQMADEFTYPLRTLGKRTPPFHHGVKGKLLTLTFDEHQTSAFARRSRQEGVTLNSALNAAMLLAINRCLYDGSPLPMRTFAFADLRSYLSSPVPPESLGCYISMLRYTIPVEQGLPFWDFARRVHKPIYASFKTGDKFSGALMSEMLMQIFTRQSMMRMGAVALSYAGVVDIAPNYGNIKMLGVHGFLAGMDLSPEFASHAHIFNDELVMDCVYLDKDMGEEMAQIIADEIRKIMESAV